MQNENEELQRKLDKAKKRKGGGEGRSSSPSPKRARGAAAKGKRKRAESEDELFDDEEPEEEEPEWDDGEGPAFETEESDSDTEGVSKAWVNRVQKYTAQIEKQLQRRADIRFEIISRLICHMSVEDRELMRKTHAFHQERYLEAKRVLQLLQQHLYTAHNSLEARLECFLPVSAIRFLRKLWSEVDGKRLQIGPEPPTHKGRGNPITEAKNKAMLGALRSLEAPYIIKDDKQIRKQLLSLLDGYTLHTACLSVDGINGAAWDFLQMCDDVLSQCETDGNLEPLPPAKEGEEPPLRVMQELYDAMKWTRKNGLTMMTLRCMQTKHGHNNSRVARNPFMYAAAPPPPAIASHSSQDAPWPNPRDSSRTTHLESTLLSAHGL